MAIINANTQKLLEERYFFKNKETGELIEFTAEDMFKRVSKEVSKAEKTKELQKYYEQEFFNLMDRQLFMPNTPTLINAGYNKCLSACSVLPRIQDSLEEIYQHMWHNAKLTKYGCGVGQDLSSIRPKGETIKTSGGSSAGVVNWMQLISAVAKTTIQGDKARRAANMVSLRFNHPDIVDFIHSKENDGVMSEMNISVTINNDEMQQIIKDEDIDLIWNNKVYKTIKAREIFQHIIDGLWQNGEPGIIWLDTINQNNPFNLQDGNFDENNAHYENTTNPCGEQPLEPYEFCNLGSINIENMYDSKTNDLNWELYRNVIKKSIRFLDDVIDINEYVLPEFKEKVLGNRKIGLGLAGFANLLIKLGIKYDSQQALDFIDKLGTFKRKVENEYNTELALEKGNFLNWNNSIFGKNNIPARCATISTQAPTGTIASILNTTAYGIEPLFSVVYKRRIVTGEIFEANNLFKEMLHNILKDEDKEQKVLEECYKKGTTQINSVPKKLRDLFRCANDIVPEWHIKIQARLQKYFDNAISKTVNAPENATKEELFDLLTKAWELGIKGVTYYRNNSRKNQTMQIGEQRQENQIKLDSIKPISRSTMGKIPGTTAKYYTACGSFFLTINRDKDGSIIESFVNVSKNGTCKSNIDGLNRMISVALRSGTKVEEIVDQLRGITCAACTRVKTKGEKKIDGLSCPDIIAKALDDEYKSKIVTIETMTEITEENTNFKCPDCGNELQLTEGCQKCSNPDCGFSKCS